MNNGKMMIQSSRSDEPHPGCALPSRIPILEPRMNSNGPAYAKVYPPSAAPEATRASAGRHEWTYSRLNQLHQSKEKQT